MWSSVSFGYGISEIDLTLITITRAHPTNKHSEFPRAKRSSNVCVSLLNGIELRVTSSSRLAQDVDEQFYHMKK